MKRFIFIVTSLLLLSGCAGPQTAYLEGSHQEVAQEKETQKKLALKEIYRSQLRLSTVAYPLLTRNVDLCGDKVSPYYGMQMWTSDSVPRELRDTAMREYGLGLKPTVFSVVPGSPAARGGLKSGDRILQVEGKDVRAGAAGSRQIAGAIKERGYKGLRLTIEKGKGAKDVVLNPVAACNFPVVLQSINQTVNAMADGKNVLIPQGMMRFAHSNDELAFVTAHELAHNVSGHNSKKMQNAIGAGIVGLLLEAAVASGGGYTNGSITNSMMEAGASAYSVQFEQEADYVGMYLLARGGYPTSGVSNFWRRMSSEINPDTIETRTSHPTSPERFVALQKASAEISAKRAAHKPLMPNMAEVKTYKASKARNYN